jgi:hypothetical protein
MKSTGIVFNPLLAFACAVLTLVGALIPTAVGAQERGIETAAAQRLKQSMDYLAGLESFALSSSGSLEVVLLTGQKLQFQHRVETIVQRPDRMHARRLGEALGQEFFYDGTTLTLHEPGSQVYASVPAPDNLEAMLHFAREQLDLYAPAGDFLYRDAYEMLMQDAHTVFSVGPAMVAGMVCDHFALSAPGTDVQLWIQQGDKPLPRRFVITSRDVVNAPQFTVTIEEWDLEPKIPSDLFRFEAPDGSVLIDFAAWKED